MAVVNVTIDPAVFTSSDGETVLAGKIVGQATMSQPPPTVWPGPGDPDYPGKPPGGGDGGPHPEHPIVLPKPPIEPPPTDPPTKPPDPQWVWGYSPREGKWLPVFVPNPEAGQPGPKDQGLKGGPR